MATSGAQGLARGLSRGLEFGLARKAAKRQEALFEQGQTDREAKIEQQKTDRDNKELDRQIAALYNIMATSKNMDDAARAQFWNSNIKPLEEKKTGKPLPAQESISSRMSKLDLKIAAIEGSNDDPAAKKASIKSLIANAERDPSLAGEVKRRKELAYESQKSSIVEASSQAFRPPRINPETGEKWDINTASPKAKEMVRDIWLKNMEVIKRAGLQMENPLVDPGKKTEINKLIFDEEARARKQREETGGIVPGKEEEVVSKSFAPETLEHLNSIATDIRTVTNEVSDDRERRLLINALMQEAFALVDKADIPKVKTFLRPTTPGLLELN